MEPLMRITLNPEVMGGKPCIRGMRVTVGTIVGLIACGKTTEDILLDIRIWNVRISWKPFPMLHGDRKRKSFPW